jgi:TRAP-type C4-dicarboxylate transport system permease small subunit
MRLLSKGLDLAENIFAFLSGILLLISVLSVTLEVASRFFFNQSFVFVSELNEYILLFMPFLAAAWLLRQNGHITVDLLDRVLPQRVLTVLNVFIAFVGFVVSGFLVWYGTVVALDAYQRDLLSLTVVQFPQVYVLAVIPLGSLLLLLEFIRKGYRVITGDAQEEQPDQALAE